MPVFAYRAATGAAAPSTASWKPTTRRPSWSGSIANSTSPFGSRRRKDAAASRGLARRSPRPGGFAARDILAFTQQLSTLVEAGLPLERALAIQSDLAGSPRLRQIVQDVTQAIRTGSTFADALARHHPRPFSRLYINTVRAGEKGGVLELALRRLADHLESARELQEAVTSALIYPALLIVVGTAAVIFLLTFERGVRDVRGWAVAGTVAELLFLQAGRRRAGSSWTRGSWRSRVAGEVLRKVEVACHPHPRHPALVRSARALDVALEGAGTA